MRKYLALLALCLLALLPAAASGQAVCTKAPTGYVCTFPPDTLIRRDTVHVTDTLRLYCVLAGTWACSPAKPTDPAPPPTDTVVAPPDTVTPPPVDTATPPPPPPPTGTNEPPGLRTIIDMDFAATKLPASFVSGPNATYGITLGKVQSPHQSNRSVPSPQGYAHRCSFGPGLVPGRGPGCYFEAKEDLAGNTSGNSAHSYRLYYETGVFWFGGANGEPTFENVGSDGFKLFGYFGGMCPGNKLSDQMILWASPAENRKDGYVTPVGRWRAQIRWNAICTTGQAAQPWPTVRPLSWPTFTAGAWHTYEVLLDAGPAVGQPGSITFWIDGVQVARWTGVLRTATAPRGWFGRHWNPVMNGKVDLRKTRVDVLDIDRVRVAVGQPVD